MAFRGLSARRLLQPIVAAAGAAAAASWGMAAASPNAPSKNTAPVSKGKKCSTGVQASVCHSGVTQGFAGTVGNTPLIGA